jgi:predicted Abi (CAAX) family protease
LLFVPALVEEYIFRVLLLPYPNSWTPFPLWWVWAVIALGLYVAYYWFRSKWGRQPVRSTWGHPTFLILIALLGLTCTIAYRVTGSLWTITFLHGIAVIVWVFILGGWKWLHLDSHDRRQIKGIALESN